MKNKILAIIYFLIGLFMLIVSCKYVHNVLLSCINGFFIGHICVMAYYRAMEF